MARDHKERRHRRTAKHPEPIALMAGANFDAVPSLSEAMGLEETTMWGIWDNDAKDWVRELPSKVDDGGLAILAFASKRQAQQRAAKHFGFETFTEAKAKDWCDVRELTQESI